MNSATVRGTHLAPEQLEERGDEALFGDGGGARRVSRECGDRVEGGVAQHLGVRGVEGGGRRRYCRERERVSERASASARAA
jgi:hypothetical protein